MTIIHCLGSGLVGSFVIKKLLDEKMKINLVDIEEKEKINDNDLLTIHVTDAIEYCKNTSNEDEIFVNMLPGSLGFHATEILVSRGKKVVDLSFSEVTPDTLNKKAIDSGAKVLWDVGIAPGFSNMLIIYASRFGGGISNAEIRVGGNPVERDEKWSYMAPFSPKDVIAEYTRPARIIKSGKLTTLPALSDIHKINVKQAGVMESFLTDGLRSLLDTISADEMTEYTVRWPGHIQRYIDERDTNFLDHEQLIEDWKFDKTRNEFTWMEVKVDCRNGERMVWTVFDQGRDGDSSMARTTGLVTASCVKQWISNPELIQVGVHPPESLPDYVIANVSQSLKDEGIEINGPGIML
jgi:saccharopine dehydrogenase-like NADP-dependent oxidoreductase